MKFKIAVITAFLIMSNASLALTRDAQCPSIETIKSITLTKDDVWVWFDSMYESRVFDVKSSDDRNWKFRMTAPMSSDAQAFRIFKQALAEINSVDMPKIDREELVCVYHGSSVSERVMMKARTLNK